MKCKGFISSIVLHYFYERITDIRLCAVNLLLSPLQRNNIFTRFGTIIEFTRSKYK